MSQPTTRFHVGSGTSLPELCALASRAVMIPPSGPSPGHRSAIHVTPNAPYFSRSPMIATAEVVSPSIAHSRASKGCPASCAIALSLPNRELAPPASTCPAHDPAVTDHPSRIRLFYRLASRPPNPQLSQFLLQALSVQTDRRRGTRNIPSMAD